MFVIELFLFDKNVNHIIYIVILVKINFFHENKLVFESVVENSATGLGELRGYLTMVHKIVERRLIHCLTIIRLN